MACGRSLEEKQGKSSETSFEARLRAAAAAPSLGAAGQLYTFTMSNSAGILAEPISIILVVLLFCILVALLFCGARIFFHALLPQVLSGCQSLCHPCKPFQQKFFNTSPRVIWLIISFRFKLHF